MLWILAHYVPMAMSVGPLDRGEYGPRNVNMFGNSAAATPI